jgi:hypothetical protein
MPRHSIRLVNLFSDWICFWQLADVTLSVRGVLIHVAQRSSSIYLALRDKPSPLFVLTRGYPTPHNPHEQEVKNFPITYMECIAGSCLSINPLQQQ